MESNAYNLRVALREIPKSIGFKLIKVSRLNPNQLVTSNAEFGIFSLCVLVDGQLCMKQGESEETFQSNLVHASHQSSFELIPQKGSHCYFLEAMIEGDPRKIKPLKGFLLNYTSQLMPVMENYFIRLLQMEKHNTFQLERGFQSSLVHCLFSEVYEEKKHPLKSYLKENLISSICHQIQQDPTRRYTVDELSKMCKMSRFHFSRVFKESTGFSPNEFLIKTRCNYAEHLLNLGVYSVTDVAEKCNYSDIYAFSRQFKKYTGQAPSQV